jgi:hypothetical protein
VKLNHSNGGGDERTKGTWSFRHPSFLRDEPSKIYEIKRYARASDREEQEDGSRVDILERRVSALQSLVDDLSRKLAAVQLTLDKAPLPLAGTKDQQVAEKPGRKRMKDIDEDFLGDDFRLSEDDIMNLFADEPSMLSYSSEEGEELKAKASAAMDDGFASTPVMTKQTSPQITMPAPKMLPPAAQQTTSNNKQQDQQQAQQAHEFISAVMSTPQFHAAITSSIQEKPKPKVEALPHLSVC